MTALLLPLLLAIPLVGEGAPAAPPQEKREKIIVRSHSENQGFLGVQIRDLDREKADELKVKAGEGALVIEVTDKSPAAKAGIQENDVIVLFDGRTISDSEDLIKAVRRVAPGTEAAVVLERKGDRKTLKVTVGKQKDEPREFTFTLPHPPAKIAKRIFHFRGGMYGLQLHELTSQLGSYFGAPEGRGILVEEVEKESPAAKAGFQAGDIILRIGSEPIEEMSDIRDGLEDYEKGEKAEVEVLRKGTRTTLSLPVEEVSRSEGSLRDEYGLEQLRELEHMRQLEHLQELEHIRPEMDRLRLNLNGMKGELRDAMEHLRISLKTRMARITV